MEENKNKNENEKLYSEKDFEEFKKKLEEEFLEKENLMKEEFQKESQKANMTELEVAKMELEELKSKYQEKENECLTTKQKEEVSSMLKEAGLEKDILELVYVPLDMEKTKEKIEILKSYIEKTKKEIFQNCSNAPLPKTSKNSEYDAFIEGAKDGFSTAVRIIPYLVAILVAIGVFRASGAMDVMIDGISRLVTVCGGDADFVGALPTALMKPLSGSGARGMMVDAMSTYGADSFVGRLSCIFQGSTDTTFYILAVYFGSVGIRYTRHAVACGLLADLAGIIAAISVAYLFFGS